MYMYDTKFTHADKSIRAIGAAFNLDLGTRLSLLDSAERKISFRKVRLENGAILTFAYETNYTDGKITRVLIATVHDGSKEQQETVEAVNAAAREFDRSRR